MIDLYGDRIRYVEITDQYQKNMKLICKRKRANLPVKALRKEQLELANEMSRIRALIRSTDLAQRN